MDYNQKSLTQIVNEENDRIDDLFKVETIDDISPEEAYKLSIKAGKPLPEYEEIIAKESRWAFYYATEVIGGRFPNPKGESVIMDDPVFASRYMNEIVMRG